jgi:hypothetical protein
MNERQWHYVKNGQQFGPVSESCLVELFRTRTLEPDAQVWTEGMEDWAQAYSIDELASLISSALQTAATAAPQSFVPPRPTSVTVFGILNIVFGGLGLLCTPFGLIAIFVMPNVVNPSGSALVWLLLSSFIGFICTILLLTVGIGLLYQKAWARIWCLGYGWFAIIWGIVGMIVNIGLTVSGAYGYRQDNIPGVIGGFCGGLIGFIYPVLLIIFMRKQHVKNACIK